MNADHYRAQVQVNKLIWKIVYGFIFKTDPAKAGIIRDKRAPEIEQDVCDELNEMLKTESGRFLFKVFLASDENTDPWTVEEIVNVLKSKGIKLD